MSEPLFYKKKIIPTGCEVLFYQKEIVSDSEVA